MKKAKYFLLIALLCICLVGCGKNNAEKKFTCTKTDYQEGMNVNQSITMNYKNDKPYLIEMKFNFEAVEDSVKQSWSLIAPVLESTYEEFANKDGIKVETKVDGYNFKLDMSFDLNKLSNDDLALFDLDNMSDASKSFDIAKKDAEADGYTCN